MLTSFKLREFIKIILLYWNKRYTFSYFKSKKLAYHLRILFNQRASKMSSYFEKSYFKKTRKCIVMAKNDLVCAKNGISIVVCSTKDCADRTSMILLIVIPSLFENI